MKRVEIYTDGACRGNPGPGGWAAILVCGKKEKELTGGEPQTTNNRMELTAAIEGLRALKQPSKVTLYSDSRYLVDGMTKGWARSWRARGWKRSSREPALNADLWAQLLELSEKHQVTFVWLRGHAGDPENERCDQLSVQAASRPGLPPDPGYRPDPQPPRLF